MRILAVVIAIAGVLAWPAVGDAASKKKSKAKPRAAPVVQQDAYGPHRARSPNPAWDVWVHNEYRGSDPDPNVRMMLQMDNPFQDP
jgi:hypothetical protein